MSDRNECIPRPRVATARLRPAGARTLRPWLAPLILAATLLAGCAPGSRQGPILEPQDEYPEFTLEAQTEAQRRLEERLASERVADLRDTTPPAEWIAYAYHGLLLDANRELIEMDEKTIGLMQRSMFEMLREEAEPGEAEVDMGELFATEQLDEQLDAKATMIVRAAALSELLEQANEALRERLEWRHRLISASAHHVVYWEDYGLSPAAQALIERFRLRRHTLWPPPDSAYVRNCRDAGVPIPPDWPDARWISQGTLNFTFISQGLSAEVFAYHDPNEPGACIALPRKSGNSISLLGIICQSDRTGKACFWDNLSAAGTRLTGANVTLDINTIQNGSNLAENCTGCHRGYNVFMIHPGTALQLPMPYDTNPQVRYTPMGQSHWSNPGPLALPAPQPGQASCVACHEIADTSPGYCARLRDAATTTMPPPGGSSAAGWPAPAGSLFRQHIDFLRARCP